MILDDGSAAISDPKIYRFADYEFDLDFQKYCDPVYTLQEIYRLTFAEVLSDEMQDKMIKADIYSFALTAIKVWHICSVTF